MNSACELKLYASIRNSTFTIWLRTQLDIDCRSKVMVNLHSMESFWNIRLENIVKLLLRDWKYPHDTSCEYHKKSMVDLDGARDKCHKIWIPLNKYLPKVPQISETLQNRWYFKTYSPGRRRSRPCCCCSSQGITRFSSVDSLVLWSLVLQLFWHLTWCECCDKVWR